MNTIDSTKVEGLSITTTPQKVWATNSSRVGIEVNCPLANTARLLLLRVKVGSGTPTLNDMTASVRIPPGETFEGDSRYNTSWDIWVASLSGTITANFYEIQN